ncbi:hypothetical protein [Pseudomonas ogarae]|uniref:P-loop NTPase n=1 Tax=Pseudomonas ogarae (strain DSM 112162 / CECT 30235 / F113) TaxID=1114970 RepID=UPI001951E255|nr:hypothetical protein [Pseudomonas ogarae]
MGSAEALISDAIKNEKPLILFLGQDYSDEGKGDPILRKFLEHMDLPSDGCSSWMSVIRAKNLTRSNYEWLAERFERSVLPESLDIIFQVAWSAVFTTSIDPQISRRLESRGRTPETILSKDHYARVARSRSRPPVHYLFGKSNELEGNYSVPANKFELMQRKNIHVNPLLSRMPETVTPLGLLVVEGYNDGRDWLEVDEMLAPLSMQESTVILWLGTLPVDSVFFDVMLQRGQIISDSRSLSKILVGLLVSSDSDSDEQLGLVEQRGTETITLSDGKFFQVPPSLRLRVEAAATIIDDSWLEQSHPLIGPALEEDFRRFHGGFGGVRTQIDGIRKGYAVKRIFEHALDRTFGAYLKNFGKLLSCIVLHGQSGTGKSVALARMASVLRVDHKLPVLYARNRIPNASDVEEFIAEAEKAGASCVVVICDANLVPDRYRDLANSLKSRGRKCIVIGSAYKVEGIRKSNRGFVEADAETSNPEVEKLESLIRKFAPKQSKEIRFSPQEKNVFALLYRHLSMSRARIIDGITEEARNAEHIVRIRARSIPFASKPELVLAQQLIALGIGKSTTSIFEDEAPESAEAGLDAAGKLIDLVMVAGRLDCPVPLNLLLRAISGANKTLNYVQIAYLFEELDLFRWHVADAEGNEYLVQPRLRLEAELICRRRLAERSKEISCLLQLISSVRRSGADGRSEISFLLDLLGKMQKEGPRKKAYQAGYLDVAKALTDLRERHDVIDASIMLQESVFRRAAVQVSDNHETSDGNALTAEQRDLILNEARQIVEKARHEIDERVLRASRKTRQSLAVEHASIYGYLAVGLARQGATEEVVWSHYLAAKTAIATAISVANNHYPFDIALWTPIDILKYRKSTLAHEMELRADVFSIFDQADTENFNDYSASKFKERKLRVAEELGAVELADEAFDSLEQTNPSVAYYLKARSMCSGLFNNRKETIPSSLMVGVPRAVSFLRDRLDVVLTDIRPLQLLIQLLWIEKTGVFIFQKDKSVIPRDRRFREDILSLVRNLNILAGDNQRNNFRLLEAVFEWTTGSAEQARDLFKELSSDTEFEDFSRVVRRFLLEGEEPKRGYKGRVIRDRGDGHWTVSVYNLAQNIDLLGRDFATEDLAVGREISNFNIAFNYLGPIADPLSRHGVRA